MMKHVSKGVYKRVSVMDYFITRNRKILSDKANFCNKCQLERIYNRTEGSYVCMKFGECEFFFQQLIIEICQVGKYVNIHIK